MTGNTRVSCQKSPTGEHEPDWKTITTFQEEDTLYIDVKCKHCELYGNVTLLEQEDADDIQW